MGGDDTSDFFAQGVKSFAFENEGDTVTGVIVHKELRQQTDVDTGKALFWDDGRPKMQVVTHLQTELAEDEEDDGLRALYIRANLRAAVVEALKAAKADDLEIGGTLTVTYVSTDAPKRKGFSGRKNYEASYTAP
jgi:hypothetical protein